MEEKTYVDDIDRSVYDIKNEEKDAHPYDLSGGQQQMAALVKVLLADPEILLLDEPTKGMDREHSRRFGELLQKLADEGRTIFMVSHDLNSVQNMQTVSG